MEENTPNIKPIKCPICGNTELAYVSEYHKSIGFRIFTMLFTIGAIICTVIDIKNLQQTQLFPITILLSILAITFYVALLITESKTGVKVICPKCGHTWNI